MKIKTFILFIFSLNIYAEDISKTLESLPKILKQVGTIDPKTNCSNCPQSPIETKEVFPTSILKSEVNKKEFEISVLTIDQANKLVKDFYDSKMIPFDYVKDGCYARAHKMVHLMEEKGIIAAKGFVRGQLFAETKYGPEAWKNHVAPVIYVKENDQLTLYIIDPGLDHSKALKYEDWKDLITGNFKPDSPNYRGRRRPPSSFSSFTNRFMYNILEFQGDRSEYYPGDDSDMNDVLQKNADIQKNLDSKMAN
jgi:hypothetical protein